MKRNDVFTILAILSLMLISNFSLGFEPVRPVSAMGGGGAEPIGRVNLAAAAFRPKGNIYPYSNSGNVLEMKSGLISPLSFYAPVNLPQGATLTKLVFHYLDDVPGDPPLNTAACWLMATDLNTTYKDNTYISYTVSSTYIGTSNYTEGFYFPKVDNSRFLYFVKCDLLYNSVTQNTDLYGVQVEYSFFTFLPFTVH